MRQKYTFKQVTRYLWLLTTLSVTFFWFVTVFYLYHAPTTGIRVILFFLMLLVSALLLWSIITTVHSFGTVVLSNEAILIKHLKTEVIPFSHVLDVDKQFLFIIIYSTNGIFLINRQLQYSEILFAKLATQIQFPRRIPYNPSRFWNTVVATVLTGLLYGVRSIFSSEKTIVIILFLLLSPLIGAFLYSEVLIAPHYIILGERQIIIKSILRTQIYGNLLTKMTVEERWITYPRQKIKQKTLVLMFNDGQELLLPANDLNWNLTYIAKLFAHHYHVALPTDI